MSKQQAITFSASSELVARLDREVVRRTVERGHVASRSEVLRDVIERGLGGSEAPKAA